MNTLKFYLLVLFFSIIISIGLNIFLGFYSLLKEGSVGILYGVPSYIFLAIIVFKLYKYLPPKMEIISRLIFSKLLTFIIVIGIKMLLGTDLNYLIQSKNYNYVFESLRIEYYDFDGELKYDESDKIMYPADKPFHETTKKPIEEMRNTKSYKITKGYGVIRGYKPVNMEISYMEKLTISGFEYFFEIVITSWFSLLLSLIVFYFEYKYRIMVRIGIRSSSDLQY